MPTRIFYNGDGVIVTARGPGTLHLTSYSTGKGVVVNHVGGISTKAGTTDKDVTRFLISHSYTFTHFAFIWEGKGEAVCGVGQELSRIPVGTSWDKATTADWGGHSFGTGDVTEEVSKALKRDNQVTCFIIPDRLI